MFFMNQLIVESKQFKTNEIQNTKENKFVLNHITIMSWRHIVGLFWALEDEIVSMTCNEVNVK
jgi:hypothetical protein